MRRLLISIAFIVAGIGSAFAYDTPEALLKALYTPYLAGDDFNWDNWDESAFRSASLNELFAKDLADTPEGDVGRLDFDPYVDGQDYQIADFKILTPVIDGDKASVEVTFKNFDLAEDLIFSLVKEADGWRVDDVSSSNKDYPYALRAILEAPSTN